MSDEQNQNGAGLSYAPAYDQSKEFDPAKAEVIASKEAVRREDFDFFRRRMEQQASMGRVLLIAVLLVAVGVNIWLTLRTQDIVIDNVNQARNDQALLDEHLLIQVQAMGAKVDALELRLASTIDAHPVDEEPAPAE